MSVIKKKNFRFLICFLAWWTSSLPLCDLSFAQNDHLKDFRGTGQKAAVLGFYSEFVDPGSEEKLLHETRRLVNHYTRSYGDASIASFTLGQNPGKRYFKVIEPSAANAAPSNPLDTSSTLTPSTLSAPDQEAKPADQTAKPDQPISPIPEAQKKFLQTAAKDNAIDIFVLGSLSGNADQIEMSLQLYDNRTETLSGIEKANFTMSNFQSTLESLVYRLMNYVDRTGYVEPVAQNLLEQPTVLVQQNANSALKSNEKEENAVNPSDLGSGYLAGATSIGGEKTPFWETWWFWALVGGGAVAVGGLTYYFAVANQGPSSANVTFNAP